MGHFQGVVKLDSRLIFLSFLVLCEFSYADPPYEHCSQSSDNYSDNSPFQKNLDYLLKSLRSNAADSMFYNTSVGTNKGEKVYGMFMCFNYVPQQTCRDYIAAASEEVLGALCPNAKQAVVWEEHCQLRYSDDNFFGKLNVSGNIPLYNNQNISQPEQFRATVDEALSNLTRVAAYVSGDMYAVGEVPFGDDTVYALVQCTRDLSPEECRDCLRNSTREILDLFYFSVGARVLSRSCYLRYELYAFYEGESETSSTKKKHQDRRSKTSRVALIIAGSACLVILIFSFIAFRQFRKKNDENQIQKSRGSVNRSNGSRGEEHLYLDLSSILAATSNFSESNKLGQGSFGPVYKGVLRDGKEVAVKRLVISSEQGSDEFTNEVLLIMKLQHKNLVKLLGFCSDGDEKLLLYEYLPNKSLDVFLFDPKIRVKLDWRTRIKIIIGIGRGILYLHEDSRLRIIHRDLKASNILLDLDMNPKISDFGIARIFAGSEGEANTSTIIGTYGYMAPEYAMEGIYSTKSDVFSFGVLLIEIISGRSNTGFSRTKTAPNLLAYAWHLWQSGQMLDLIDPLIARSCEAHEFLRYVHIGLLCVQEDASERPTMSSVVLMLKSESTVTLCQPKRPAFFTGRLTKFGRSVVELDSASFTISNVSPR